MFSNLITFAIVAGTPRKQAGDPGCHAIPIDIEPGAPSLTIETWVKISFSVLMSLNRIASGRRFGFGRNFLPALRLRANIPPVASALHLLCIRFRPEDSRRLC